jgi:hypothetical protein
VSNMFYLKKNLKQVGLWFEPRTHIVGKVCNLATGLNVHLLITIPRHAFELRRNPVFTSLTCAYTRQKLALRAFVKNTR